MRKRALLARDKRSRTASSSGEVKVLRAWLAFGVTAFLLAALGTGLMIRNRSGAPADYSETLGGLSVQLHNAGWLTMDGHDMGAQGGYQMPAQMMPGAPAGDDMRFGVPLTLINTSGGDRRFNTAEEFFLRGGPSGDTVAPHSDTFGRLGRLSPGSAVDGVLYFDTTVPDAGDPPLYLEWRRDGDTTRLAIPLMAGGQPQHGDHTR
jgi:hypothetical protein